MFDRGWPRPISRRRSHVRSALLGAYDWKLWTLYLHEDPAEKPLSSELTLLHELCHFFQASTPYGFYLGDLDRTQNEKVRAFCTAAAALRADGRIFMPVFDWISSTRDRALRKLAVEHLHPWCHAEYVRDALEGQGDAKGRKAIESLQVVEQCRLPSGARGPASPPMPYAKNRIGGSHVCETGATVVESIELVAYRRQLPMAELEAEFGRRVHSHDYDALMKLVYDRTDFMGMERMMVTVLALCDLALFTPLPWLASQPDMRKLSWSDLHPGWRFVRALEEIEHVPPPRGEAVRTGYTAYLDAIAKRCGWPSVSAILRAGAQMDGGTDVVRMMFRDACRLRERLPTIFTLPGHPENDAVLQTEFLPLYAPMVARGGGTFSAGGSHAGSGAFAIFIATYGMRALMLCESLEELVPDAVAANAAERDSIIDRFLDGALGLRRDQVGTLRTA